MTIDVPALRRFAAARAMATLALALAALIALALARPGAFAADAQEALEPLAIEASGKTYDFKVEVMRTDSERAKGLMFRRYMAEDRGMLFDFKTEQTVTMWMRNTFIPLDMIFIGRDGRIVGVAENTEPMSERIIPSGAPALAVLEVNAGTAARLGVKIGDRIRHTLFK
ncbi:MAG: DUF192 domain-containing protein [Rhizobiales bacterium]|nr:DUF192 domain-containing protein [Hyphomicrobiales bacterium]